jgi:signal transduction histidine kinase
MMAKPDSRPHFEVHPSVVYQLGESLISDAVQALIELVKNCYDADATYAKVVIDTTGTTDLTGTFYQPLGGRIIVEDDGHGMSLEDIDDGWLTISNRKKRDFKLARKLTGRGRTPLGDKGLGRLGVQRLGEKLEIFTKTKADGGVHLGFSWSDFASKARLQDVEIQLDDWDGAKQPGTCLVISNLRELEMWKGRDAIRKLQTELSQMISPFKGIRDFLVLIEVDGKTVELQEITEKVRDIAPLRYDVKFDGTAFTVTGRARLNFFCPPNREAAKDFSLIAEGDDGQAFFDFLTQQKHAKTVNLQRSSDANWFVEFNWERKLEDMDGVERVAGPGSEIANPGPFVGEVDAFDLANTAFDRQNIFDRISEFRDHIKTCSGIRVFRDGFAIRVDHDWLKLGTQWTSASSYYGLKPNNTLGYIALSARENMDLEETTNREEFKDTPFYRNFYELLMGFKRFTELTQEFLGRSWGAFRDRRKEELANVDSRKTVEDIAKAIRDGLTGATRQQVQLDSFRERIKSSMNRASNVSKQLAEASDVSPSLRRDITDALDELNPLLVEAQRAIGETSKFLGDLGTVREMGQVLDRRVDTLREQMDNMYETVALGLTAEALSHEIFNIADQLATRTKKAKNRLRSLDLNDTVLTSFIEHVKSSGMALRKQMSFLSPALRYVREQRETIELQAFMNELSAFYRERLDQHKISVRVESGADSSLRIHMNRGKLTQIIDNFVLNSEYWLREDISQGRMDRGFITIEVSRPFVRIYDSGRGIDTNIEHALFEPFVSAKGKGRGRGLGLFIVKQLVDSEGCSVGILPERNSHRRLFKFQIDFRGAIDE